MKNKIKIATQTQTIQALTKKMLSNDKYAYVCFPKTSLQALGNNKKGIVSETFVSEIQSSFDIKNDSYMKAIPASYVYNSEKEEEIDASIFKDNSIYFNSSTLESYFYNNQVIFDSFVEFYIKNTPYIIVSFNDKKQITKLLGFPAGHIHVPYNNYENQLDNICEKIDAIKDRSDMILLDCSVFSSALAHRIWNNFNLSILDFGKIISFSKSKFINEKKFNEKNSNQNR